MMDNTMSRSRSPSAAKGAKGTWGQPPYPSATCTTNFTVVKVDVTIGDVGEDKEETEGAFVQFVPDAPGGLWTSEGTNALVNVSIMCEPELPTNETVSITAPEGALYARLNGKYYAMPGEFDFPAHSLTNVAFFLHGHDESSTMTDKVVAVTHRTSGAKDVAKYTNISISLVTPSGDPVANPVDSGDGQNEFTYSSGIPGVLTMNLKASVSPESVAPFIQGDCLFEVGVIGDSALAWDAINPNGVPQAIAGCLTATARFTGLPQHNSDFGKKVASISLHGMICDTSEYEVFFPADANNHPNRICNSGDCSMCPNWFYYWREGGECSIPIDSIYSDGGYDENTMFYGQLDLATSKIVIGRDSIGNMHSNQVTGIVFDTTTDQNGFPISILRTVRSYIGATAAGIRSVAATVKHELKHQEIFNMYVKSPDYLPGVTFEIGDEVIESGGCPINDVDNDRVLDLDEKSSRWGLETDVGNRDTYGMASIFGENYSSYGDNEVQARWAESIELEDGVSYFSGLDWANPGCQSKDPRGPYPQNGTQ